MTAADVGAVATTLGVGSSSAVGVSSPAAVLAAVRGRTDVIGVVHADDVSIGPCPERGRTKPVRG
jgi:hypothetical protein